MGKNFIDKIVNTIAEEVVKKLSSQNDKSKQMQTNMDSLDNDSFFIKHRKIYKKIKHSEIFMILAERSVSIIHTHKKRYVISGSLGFIEKQISNAKNLVRVNRSCIVNVDKIDSLNYGDSVLYLENGVSVIISNHYSHKLLEKIKILKTR